MKSPVTLLRAVVHMYGDMLHIKTVRDEETIVRRYESQQSWFLEVSLPTLDDALLSGLSSGALQPIKGYKLQSRSSLPRFLNGFWGLIFDSEGFLLSDPCPTAIQAIRQISNIFKKIKEVCSDDAVKTAINGFQVTDAALSQVKIPSSMDTIRLIAQQLFSRTIGAVFSEDLTYSHGPGAVAERADSVGKYDFNVVPDALVKHVGMDVFKPFYWQSETVDGEVPARLIAVPKTATKPRLISIEPSYNQFIQQGIHTVLKRELGKNRICGYLSQEPNRILAKEGSVTGDLATIDLSEASDRVHYGVLKAMFGFNRSFLSLIDACRSRLVELPDGRLLALNKFASMGSALTFPIEAMYFTVLVIYSICETDGDFSRAHINGLLRSDHIRVYGDDIIVPTKYVPAVFRNLEMVGLKVNSGKSFFKGHFRESCGADYWLGHDVRPIYVRERMPKTQRDVNQLISYVSFRNQIHDRFGDCEVTSLLDSWLESILPGLPYGDASLSSDLVLQGDRTVVRWNKSLYRGERRGYVPVYKRKRVSASDEARLHKAISIADGSPTNLLKMSTLDKDHLTHHSRPTSATIRRRWVPAL